MHLAVCENDLPAVEKLLGERGNVNSEETALWARFLDSMASIVRASHRGSHLCRLRRGRQPGHGGLAAGGRRGLQARFLTTGSGRTVTSWLTYSVAHWYRWTYAAGCRHKRGPGLLGVVAVQGRDGSLLRAFAFITSPLFRSLFLMWLLAGTAWGPSWWSFGQSAPSFLELTLCVVLPSILLALVASLGRWCLAWWKTIPTVSLPGIDRPSRFFRPVDAGLTSNQAAPTFRCSASHLILPTASFPIQETLVNAVGLTSVARRLQ